MVYTKQQEGKR